MRPLAALLVLVRGGDPTVFQVNLEGGGAVWSRSPPCDVVLLVDLTLCTPGPLAHLADSILQIPLREAGCVASGKASDQASVVGFLLLSC